MRLKDTIRIGALLLTIAVAAQSAKRSLTPADYKKWGKLSGETIAPDGNGVSFKMEYQSGNDTLFIVNMRTTRKLEFPKAVSATFSPDGSRCAIKYTDNKLSIIDMKSTQSVDYSNVARFDFIIGGGGLLLTEEPAQPKKVQALDKQNKPLWQLDNVVDYSVGKHNRLAVINNDGVALIDLQKKGTPVSIITGQLDTYSRLTWSKSGNALAFFSQSKSNTDSIKIALYNVNTKSLAVLDAKQLTFEGTPYNIEPYKLIVSEDDKKVYFNITDIPNKNDAESLVEIWDTATMLEWPQQQLLNDPATHPYLAIWDAATGNIQKVDSGDFTDARIVPGGRYALAESKSSMISRSSEFPPADYYSIDLMSGKSTLIDRQCATTAGTMKVSPSGRFIAYFKDGHYFVFDNQTNRKTNITAGMPVSFLDAEFDDAGGNPGYYSPGWLADDSYVVLYDEFDVWLCAPDGKVRKKITNGRPTATKFRVEVPRSDKVFDNGMQPAQATIDLKKGVALSSKGSDYTSGWYWFSEKEGLRKLCEGKYKATNFNKANRVDRFIFTEETDARPPRVMLLDKTGFPTKEVFQSNKHYVQYAWSRSELIAYKNSQGDELKGVLMYPANYTTGKKYPMIVYIYERLSKTLYDYIIPVPGNQIGFSPPHYLHDGYLVLMPDIKYKIGLPGPSAVDCVTAAVNSVVKKGIVGENQIGLLGHSFGGFQTAFIITQTQLFAAAVASGAITDPVSAYLSRNPQRYRSENWRFEDHQYRMQSTPFNNWDGYCRNSTIANAVNITTPLLSWHGKSDASVNFEQGLELHLALRTLQKPNLFLVYPNQAHVLFDPVAQLDLTTRVKDWFDKYLKK